MIIEISDATNESFVLNKECPSKTFHFTTQDFSFFINHVRLATVPENEDWQGIILKTEIRLQVNYNYVDHEADVQFEEISFPIHLFVDPNKIEPYFTINKLIDRKLFGKGFDLNKIDQISVRIVLLENEKINIPYHYKIETSYKKS
jgi:hypothetical protein